MARASVAEYVREFAGRGNETAYVERNGYRTVRSSYRQVAETAFRFARELQAREITKGDRVFIWGANSAHWVSVFFGCALVGAVVVPMDDAAAPDFARRVAAQAGGKLIVCSRHHAGNTALPSLIFEELGASLSRRSAAPFAPTGIAASDPLQIVFTSGTTAEPKGVVITHGNVLANVAPLETEIRKYLKYERLVHPVRFLNLLPLSHVFGQFLGIFLPQILGGAVVFQDALKPAEVIATIRRERVSVLVAVPRMLQSLKEKVERDIADQGRETEFQEKFQSSQGKHFLLRWWIFRRIRKQFGWKFWAFISGGAALDPQTEKFWDRLGYAVIQGYGLTETTSLVSVNHPFHLGQGSIGKVLAGREVKLAPDGEILVRGGGVAAGYWDGNQLKPVTSEEGWYGTGDIGELDAEGNLYFKGRKKDVIVTPAGMNVYPEDLENALQGQPEVKDCLVIALPRDGNADPCAVLILRHAGANPEAIVKRANESLAGYQRMRAWFVWPEQDFPRTSTQKPRTGQIEQAVKAALSAKPAPGSPSSPLAELIAKVSGRPAGSLAAGASLETDLNLSSLERVDLLSAVEERYQIDLGDAQFSAVNTVGDLEKMLQGKRPPRAHYHYPRWAQRWPATWIRFAGYYLLLRPMVFLRARPQITGRENVRSLRGPALVVCNHISDVDFAIVKAALPARIGGRIAVATRGEDLEALRTPPASRNMFLRSFDRVKWALGVALFNLFPLPQAAGFRESFSYAGECMDRGCSVLVFPEGRHTRNGKINPFRAGIGVLANSLSVPVLPMRIDGLFALKEAGKTWARGGEIQVKIGAAMNFSGNQDPQQIAQELERAVRDL